MTADLTARLAAAGVRVKPLVWEPLGSAFHAFDPLFTIMAIAANTSAYDEERSARILAALEVV